MTNKLIPNLVLKAGIHLIGCTSDKLMYDIADSFEGDYNMYRDSLLKFDSIIIWRTLSQIVDAITGQRALNHTKQHVFLYNLTCVIQDKMGLFQMLSDFCKDTDSIIIFIAKGKNANDLTYYRFPDLLKLCSNSIFCGGTAENMSIDIVKSKSSANDTQNEKVYLQQIGRTLRPQNKGCNTCKNHKATLGNRICGVSDMTYTCLVGNTDACNTWWQNNGKLSSNDKTEDMPCFENTEINEMLENAIETTNEILLRIKIKIKT